MVGKGVHGGVLSYVHNTCPHTRRSIPSTTTHPGLRRLYIYHLPIIIIFEYVKPRRK
ncbi:hypothetical protein AG1IA_10221 [Rhizoctonia solani AG-1 IA]|uniref:Uncharacterized protein n=1 Tax=Thanatephorus cucumeris (strain AG1-IA) TaxID=983506 RepID=L8WH99_THACA|nr:hypothetical protein AG1IA_10221 [Rhizoctonia solani AG-1 IA]